MNLAMNTTNPRSNLTEMYPGIYQPGQAGDGLNLPTRPLNTLLGFELETYQIPLDQLLPSKKVPDGVMSTRKYKQIVSSINEVGLIEPLSVIQPDRKKPEYLVLDGHLRVLALKELGMSVGPCLFAKDDETFSYNHHINRLSTIAEHYMIRRAIDRGVSKERLARAFNVNLSSINRRINLLEGICPEAITLLQDKQFTPDVTRILRNMKAARQVEAVELMIASNTITVAHAEALLKATPPEQRADVKPAEKEKKTAPIEQIEKLEKEMSQVQESYTQAEQNYGSDLLNLVVAKGYLTKLLANESVQRYLGQHQPEILSEFQALVDTEALDARITPGGMDDPDATDGSKMEQGADSGPVDGRSTLQEITSVKAA